jgi:HEAT repeat protein
LIHALGRRAGRTAAVPAAALVLLAACASERPAAAGDDADPVRIAVERLLAAAPADWPERLPPVLAAGREAVPWLVGSLRSEPDRPGAQPAIAALGRIGDPAALPCLSSLLADRGEPATEAALALGQLGAHAAIAPLRAAADDRLADATLRAACAASLLRLGERAALEPLVRGLLLAGTPAGRDLQQRLGLPEKARWALERYLLQQALRAAAGTDFGLDTDASWPRLLEVADAVSKHLLGGA